jgi:CheY-like chemotaxis protein/HPt (histidine-containing phosphotransfer) domain-containing protein
VIRIFSPDRGDPAGTARSGEGAQREQQTLTGARVLLVEDNEINQQIAMELLQQAGAEVDVASNGREAVEKLQIPGRSFDVVLMDIQMPEMDGYEATRLIRAEPRFAGLPIVALTAHAMVEERQRAMESGMNDQITKPIDPQALIQTMARFYTPQAAGAPRAVHERGDAGADIPAIAGVDVTAGLQRVGGNLRLYLKLLRQFEESQKGAIVNIRDALAVKDRSTAERISHTLKGVAGNLGAVSVQHAAAAVEKSIRENEPSRCTKKLVGDCESALENVLHAIGERTAANAEVEPTLPSFRTTDPEHVRSAVEKLRKLVQESDSEAVEFLEEVRMDLQAACPAEVVMSLEKALQSYDFPLALEVLKDCNPGKGDAGQGGV